MVDRAPFTQGESIAACKYLDHLPLYRIEQIAARHGVPLARSSLAEPGIRR